jgi:hypothetical protein
MTEGRRVRILAGEHLPDGVASQREFLEFFRHLLRASADDFEATGTEVRVVCWLAPDSVQHYIVVRDSDTGRVCCRLEVAIAARVCPAELDRHATDLARVLGEALNLSRFPPPPDGLGDTR